MATWIAHLRIAENILNKGYNFDPKYFAVGNIGPDSGVPNDDWSNFNPPKKITHWKGEDNKINAQGFWDKYLSDKEIEESNEAFSFKIGYFVHLLTDIEWSKLFNEKKKEALYKEGLEKDQNFIWTIKKDWYGLDYLYLEKNPESIFNTLFRNISSVTDYLDYFPQGAFERQVKYITDFYLGENNETKENFIYLNEEEMDNFIGTATKIIDELLRELLIEKAAVNNTKAMKLEEDMFPKTFTNFIEKDFGILFYNEQNKFSHDSNHALIYKNNIKDLGSVLDFITEFYSERNITPSIYQATEDEGYFKENEAVFNRHGYSVRIEGQNNFMVLTGENVINSSNKLDIKLITEWDERIASDICMPSDEAYEIEVIKNSISCKNYRVFVGYIDNKAAAVTYFHISGNGCCRFDYILISNDYRNNGFARELLSYVTDFCRENNLKNCFTWPAHKTSERICYEAGFRHLFYAEAARASYC